VGTLTSVSSSSFAIDKETRSGRFERQESKFREWVHQPVAGRYHLYVALACPWSQRAVIVHKLKGLEDAISISYAAPYRDDRGWAFPGGKFVDDLHGWDFLQEAYAKTDPEFEGRVTVPVLWDKERRTIVSNESSEIIRMLDEELGADSGVDLRPMELREEIDAINPRIYDHVNNGVYKAGFASSQEAYEEAATALFDTLDWLEARLEGRTYLVGERLTEADVRLFTTLVRFDPVYHVHFKCTKKRLRDYPNLWALTKRIYQTPGVRETVRFDHIRRHYYYSHARINPHRIVPLPPDIVWESP
jgi:putative glutathione S-transferase